MDRASHGEQWYFQNLQEQGNADILRLAEQKPNAPVILSQTLGYKQVPPAVVEYLSEPGMRSTGQGAGFGMEASVPGLRQKALEALKSAGIISEANSVQASNLQIIWEGTAKEAADRIKNKKS